MPNEVPIDVIGQQWASSKTHASALWQAIQKGLASLKDGSVSVYLDEDPIRLHLYGHELEITSASALGAASPSKDDGERQLIVEHLVFRMLPGGQAHYVGRLWIDDEWKMFRDAGEGTIAYVTSIPRSTSRDFTLMIGQAFLVEMSNMIEARPFTPSGT